MLQSFKMLVFLGSQSCPCVVDDIGKGGIASTFFNSVCFPLVSEVFSDFYSLETLVNPVVGVPKTLIVLEGLLFA